MSSPSDTSAGDPPLIREQVAMRPEGIGRCHRGHHPVLLFREIAGVADLVLRIDEREARLLADQRDGRRNRHSRTYETLEQVVTGLGATIIGLELVGDRRRGLTGVIEVARDRWRPRIHAHPGDIAVLAWRLHVPVFVPADLISAPRAENWEWSSDEPCAVVAETDAAPAFRRFLDQADPNDFDW